MQIGEEIKRLRGEMGLRELSRLSGVSLSSLQAIESGGGRGSNPTVETANKILGVFGKELKVGRRPGGKIVLESS